MDAETLREFEARQDAAFDAWFAQPRSMAPTDPAWAAFLEAGRLYDMAKAAYEAAQGADEPAGRGESNG